MTPPAGVNTRQNGAGTNNPYQIKHFLLAAIAFVSVLLRLHSHGEPLERDLTTYAYIGHRMLGDGQLYTTLWDNKPPGVYIANMLAEFALGYSQHSITFLGIILSLVSIFFLFHFMERVAGTNAALAGAAFWALASNSISLQANQPNTEAFVNAFTIMAIWAFARYYGGGKKFLLLSGTFFGLATFFKTIAVFPIAALCVYLALPLPGGEIKKWLKKTSGKLTLFLLPTVVIWLATFSYFGLLGRFYDLWGVLTGSMLYAGNIFYNTAFLFMEPKLLFHESLKDIAVLALFAIAWLPFSGREYGPLRRSFFVLFLAGLLVEVASPGKFFSHYYQLLLPVFIILASLFLSDMAKRLEVYGKPLMRSGVALLFILPLLYLVYFQATYLRMTPEEISIKKYGSLFVQAFQLGEDLAKKTGSCETIYEWGAEPGIYYYSKRESASDIFFAYAVYLGSEFDRVKRFLRLHKDLTSSPPAFFVWNNSDMLGQRNVIRQFVDENYISIEKSDTFSLYEYRHRKPPGQRNCK